MSDQSKNEQNQGDLAQEILNRILSDGDFRQNLLDNPAETLTQAGYIEGDDVSGYSLSAMGHAFGAGKVAAVEPTPPITTAITCGPVVGTTAITCGPVSNTGAAPKPKPKPQPTPATD
jgi:hypothetical protein